jgi:predicted exporter
MSASAGAIATTARRHVIGLWLVCVAIAAVVTVRSHYVADLTAFLPSTPSTEQAVLLDQLRTGVATRLVLIGIEGGDAPARRRTSLELAAALRSSGAFETVHNGDNSQFEATGRFLFEHRYLLSPAVDAQRFTVAGLRSAIDETTSLLGTPAGAAIKSVILRDPTGETVRMAETMLPANAPRDDGAVWTSRDGSRAVLLATTRADGADLDAQERALQLVQRSFDPLAKDGLHMIVSGAGTFAVASRAQIKAEVERLAVAGGVAIVALLLLAFGGSLRTLATALLPVASGVLAGIAAVSLIFGNVHGVTLGFGTTLIGEAVDYAIYYLIQARPLPGTAAGAGARRWIDTNWPTVRLGLATSICGFAALLFSGFPGLRQLGVFSIAGLAAAALTTRCVFPVLAPDGAPGVGARRHLGRFVGWCMAVLPRLRWPLAALTGIAALALALLPSPWHGDLGSLSPVGAERMKIDAELRADLGASDASTLVAVSAADEGGVLAQAEAVGDRLDTLVNAGKLLGYESPARLLPSPATQQRRREALPDASTLTTRLQQATVDGPLPAARLDGFIADVQAARSQPLLTRAALQGTPLAAAVDAQLVPGNGHRPWRALLSLQIGPHDVDTATLRAALAAVPGAQVVNIGTELGGLYARYLHEATLQALLGGLAVCVLLLVQQRSWRRLVRVALPVIAAVLLVLAALTAAGVALGILHLVGLLLTVAIGSNYALFFDQIRTQQDRDPAGSAIALDHDTLASLALANLTAVTSFCLLAFSSIPVLYSVGQVVAPGILLSLLLSAAFIPAARR